MKKAFYIAGIVAFIVMVSLAVGHFYVILRYSPHLNLLKPAGHTEAIPNQAMPLDLNEAVNPTSGGTNVKRAEESSRAPAKEEVSPEFYLGEITNFYGNVIVILFSTIGILLAVSFIYVYTVSRGKAEDLARQALNEESFQITLNDRVEKSLAKLKNEGEIGELIDKMADFEERIDFLEKAITNESYQKAQLGEASKLEGDNSNGGNKTI